MWKVINMDTGATLSVAPFTPICAVRSSLRFEIHWRENGFDAFSWLYFVRLVCLLCASYASNGCCSACFASGFAPFSHDFLDFPLCCSHLPVYARTSVKRKQGESFGVKLTQHRFVVRRHSLRDGFVRQLPTTYNIVRLL